MTTLKTITLAVLVVPAGLFAGLALVIGYTAALFACLACGIDDWRASKLEGYNDE